MTVTCMAVSGGGISHSSSYSSSASASGYTSSPVLSRYPIPQQIHRVGVDCDTANTNSNSSDHDFYPPIPLDCDGASTTAERLLKSQFVSPSNAAAANSSGSNSSAGRGDVMKRVRYGDFIRLWASSAYTHKVSKC
jgi:hypothetical protein